MVVGNNCELLRAAPNIPGVDIVKINEINAELLAPGADAGRLTLFTQSAIERLDNEKLFYTQQKPAKVKEEKASKKEKKSKRKKKKNKETKKADKK